MGLKIKGKINLQGRTRHFPNAESWLLNGAFQREIFVNDSNNPVTISSDVVNKLIVSSTVTSANIIIEGSTFPFNIITTPTTAMNFAPNTPFENQLSAVNQIYSFTVNGIEYQIIFEN